jgi:hypothetical protein
LHKPPELLEAMASIAGPAWSWSTGEDCSPFGQAAFLGVIQKTGNAPAFLVSMTKREIKEWIERHRPPAPGEYRRPVYEPLLLCLTCREMKRESRYAFKGAQRCIDCDAGEKIASVLRSRLCAALRGSGRSKRLERYLGCSVLKFRAHLESLFVEGMSWENRAEWHVDHIVPVCRFNHLEEREIMACWHYTNLRPLWAHLNLKKSGKVGTGI